MPRIPRNFVVGKFDALETCGINDALGHKVLVDLNR
jgi:hypothetical protein